MNDTVPSPPPQILSASTGEFPLQEYRLRSGGREWSILHTNAVLSFDEETEFLRDMKELLPYGVALWPASVALAHEVATRGDEWRGKRVLELGAGTGLPGIIAASLGGRVVQSDRHELALAICRRNGERNELKGIEYRLADWSEWQDTSRYERTIGSDILYSDIMHPHLRRIFETNLAPGGTILVSDPFRRVSMPLLEKLELEGWRITVSKWTVGQETAPRSVGVFELASPSNGAEKKIS